MEAWSCWHDDKGNPDEAAPALETLLMRYDVGTAFQLSKPDDPLLIYVSHLLTALLGKNDPYPFASMDPLPPRLGATLLGVYLKDYALIRRAALAFQEKTLQTAADNAAALVEQVTVPWLRLLVYELWADVVTAAREHDKYKAAAAVGNLGDLIDILNRWRSLWPGENPIAGARFYEAQGQAKRAEHIRWHLGELALEQHIQGNDKGARRLLEVFSEAELPSTRMPGSRGASIQQLWTFLSASGDKQARMVFELEHADEAEVESWIKTEDPYGIGGACPKAVLLTDRSFVYTRKMSCGADDLRRYLHSGTEPGWDLFGKGGTFPARPPARRE